MAVKSVIDIDVNDASFKRFSTLFGKYQDALSKQPDLWKKVNAAQQSGGSKFDRITAALMAQNQLHREIGQNMGKSDKTLEHHASLWTKIHRSTTGVLKDVTSVATWLTKMGVGLGLTGVGAGIAGLFGLMGMASQVSGERNNALSIGGNIGWFKAFEKFTGRNLSSPDTVLQNAFLGQTPGTNQYGALTALRVSTQGTPLDVADRLLMRLREMAKTTPPARLAQEYQWALSQLGISAFDIEKLHSLLPGELSGLVKEQNKWLPQFYQSQQTGKSFQDFQSRIEAIGHSFMTQLERDVVPLLGPIEHLVGTFGRDVNILLRGGVAKRGINLLASALDDFTKYMASGKFTKAISDFGNDVQDFATVIKIWSWPMRKVAGGVENTADFLSWAAGKGSAEYNAAESFIKQHLVASRSWDTSGVHIAPTQIPMMHVHIDPLPLIKIHVTKIPAGDAVQVIQQLHGGT